jgi:hypothetical protein
MLRLLNLERFLVGLVDSPGGQALQGIFRSNRVDLSDKNMLELLNLERFLGRRGDSTRWTSAPEHLPAKRKPLEMKMVLDRIDPRP